MNPHLQELIASPAFWTLSPEQQRQAIERLDPRFAGLSEEHYQRGFQMLTERYRPKTPLQPGPTGIEAGMPAGLKENVQAGMGAVDQVLRRAKTGFAQPFPGPLRPAAERIYPGPGTLPQAVGMGTASVIPGGGLLGPVLRSAGSGVASGLTAHLMGQENPEITALEQAGGQMMGELPFMAARGVLGQRQAKGIFEQEQAAIQAGKQAHAQYPGKMAQFRQSEQQRRAQWQDLERQNRNQFAQQKAQFKGSEAQRVATAHELEKTLDLVSRERQAGEIANVVKAQVPAFSGAGTSAKDLWHMAYGELWKNVQTRYDQALQRVATEGRGQMVQMKTEAAEALGLRGPRGPKDAAEVDKLDHMMVDAGDLAQAMTGKWANRYTRGAYRQAARALDEAGIGNPEAREEYRNASAFRAFADKSQMLEGQEFHPERVQKALGKLKANEEVLGARQNVELFRTLEAQKPREPGQITPERPFRPYQQGPAFQPGTPPPQPAPIPEGTVTYGPLGARSVPATIAGVGGGVAGSLLGKEIGHPYLGYSLGHAAGQALGGRIPAYQGGPPLPAPGLLGRGGRAVAGGIGERHIKEAWDYIMSDETP